MIYDINKEIIGIINFNNSITEENIDKNDPDFGFGSCEVYIWKKEGDNIPHIHIKNDKIDTCVCIYTPYYFLHGNSHVDHMNNKACNKFNDWMKKYNKRPRYSGFTNWEVASILWKSAFPDSMNEVTKQPDYTKLNYNGDI